MTKLTINVNGEETEIEVTRQGNRLSITRNGRTAEVELLHQDGPSLLLAHGRQRIRAIGHAGGGDERQLWVNGRTHSYQRIRQRGQSAGPGAGSLAATIPAVVTEILVEPGQPVQEGDRLILLESMKMVIPIQAPYAGTITQINCAAGESVQAGMPLIELKKIED
jgi:biotin carboxyl carrier protein